MSILTDGLIEMDKYQAIEKQINGLMIVVLGRLRSQGMDR